MGDLILDFDSDSKQINVENSPNAFNNTSIVINPENDQLIGVELLANKNNTKPVDSENDKPLNYTRDEDNSEKENDFFLKSDDSSETKRINVPIGSDPIMNNEHPPQDNNSDYKPIHMMGSQDIKNEKIDLIYKFKRLETQGIRTTMNYNMNSSLDDMRNEYIKLKKQREVNNSIKFQRKAMMAIITGVEFMNNKFDPFDIKLDGWSESINDGILDYDEVFEELAEKYSGESEMAPEIKLLMMLGGSAFMFHLTNTMFKTSIPGMDDIMKQNPDLMKQFAKAAVSSIGKENNISQNNQTGFNTRPPMQQNQQKRPDMKPPDMSKIMSQINLQPRDIPDLDNISIISGDSELSGRSGRSAGITLNL